jgi:hypothetical protein
VTVDRRTLRGWFEYLDDAKRELTLSEFMAVMVFNQREYLRLALDEIHHLRLMGTHSEDMLGRLDLLAATIAERSGLPYPDPERRRPEMAERSNGAD